jgi:transposase-like protein
MDKYLKLTSSRYHIRYTAEFKNRVCKEYLGGEGSKIELQRKYGITGHCRIKDWLERFPYIEETKRSKQVKEEPSHESTRAELEKRVKQLQRQLEDSRLKEEAYRKMIEIAEKELKIKIRKK